MIWPEIVDLRPICLTSTGKSESLPGNESAPCRESEKGGTEERTEESLGDSAEETERGKEEGEAEEEVRGEERREEGAEREREEGES